METVACMNCIHSCHVSDDTLIAGDDWRRDGRSFYLTPPLPVSRDNVAQLFLAAAYATTPDIYIYIFIYIYMAY